jgi:hypothetical protein
MVVAKSLGCRFQEIKMLLPFLASIWLVHVTLSFCVPSLNALSCLDKPARCGLLGSWHVGTTKKRFSAIVICSLYLLLCNQPLHKVDMLKHLIPGLLLEHSVWSLHWGDLIG